MVGVDSIGNLQENVKALSQQARVKKVYDKLLGLKEDDERLVVPTNWK